MSQTTRLIFIVIASAWILSRVVLWGAGIEPLGCSIVLPSVALCVVSFMYWREARA